MSALRSLLAFLAWWLAVLAVLHAFSTARGLAVQPLAFAIAMGVAGLFALPLEIGRRLFPRGGRVTRGLAALFEGGLLALLGYGLALGPAHQLASALPGLGAPLLLLGAALALALTDAGMLRRVLRLTGIEWRKTAASRLFRLALLAVLASTFLGAWLHTPEGEETGWSVAMTGVNVGSLVAEVFVFVLGAIALAGEAAGGTLKMVLPHAFRRSDWIAAKALVLLSTALLFAIAIGAVAFCTAEFTHGLGDIERVALSGFGGEETVEVLAPASALVERCGWLLLMVAVGMMTHGLVGLLLSSLSAGVVAPLSLAFLLLMGMRTADVLLRLPEEALRELYAWYPGRLRDLVEKLGAGFNDGLRPDWFEAIVSPGLLAAVATGVAAWVLATGVFRRRDIHA